MLRASDLATSSHLGILWKFPLHEHGRPEPIPAQGGDWRDKKTGFHGYLAFWPKIGPEATFPSRRSSRRQPGEEDREARADGHLAYPHPHPQPHTDMPQLLLGNFPYLSGRDHLSPQSHTQMQVPSASV